jgi:hypothetical protein
VRTSEQMKKNAVHSNLSIGIYECQVEYNELFTPSTNSQKSTRLRLCIFLAFVMARASNYCSNQIRKQYGLRGNITLPFDTIQTAYEYFGRVWKYKCFGQDSFKRSL